MGLKVKVNHLLARNRLVFMRRPERFAGAFIICNWIICPSFCPFISPFVNYSLSLTYKVHISRFWVVSKYSNCNVSSSTGGSHVNDIICPLGFGRGQNTCIGLEYFARFLLCCHRGHLCLMNLSCCTTILKFPIDSGSLGQSSRSF